MDCAGIINREPIGNPLLEQIKRVSTFMHRLGGKLLQEHGVNLQVDQLVVFLTVQMHPGVSQQEIANFASRDKSSINRTIKKLEQQGLVQTSVSPSDRRLNQILMTPLGDLESKRIAKAGTQLDEILKTICGQEEYSQVEKVLTSFATKLEAYCDK